MDELFPPWDLFFWKEEAEDYKLMAEPSIYDSELVN